MLEWWECNWHPGISRTRNVQDPAPHRSVAISKFYYAVLRQRVDLGRRIAELAQHLGRLRAETLWGKADLGGLAIVKEGVVDKRQRGTRLARASNRHQRFHVRHLRIGGDLCI